MDVPNHMRPYEAPSNLDASGMPYPMPQPQSQPSPLQAFWAGQMAEIESMMDFKNNALPLVRIKRIMKADREVKMVANEVPVVFSKACEMFILEMTLKAWNSTEADKRRTLQRCDLAAAVKQTDVFDFLVDVIRRDDKVKDNAPPRGAPPAPYFLIPTQQEAMMPLMQEQEAMIPLMQDPAYLYGWDGQPLVQGQASGVVFDPQAADNA